MIFMQFVAFPSRSDSIFDQISDKQNEIMTYASGSMGLFYFDYRKCFQTYPNQTLKVSADEGWCSNIATGTDKPWITYSLKNKKMKLTGYSVRNGCCRHRCCCVEDNKPVDDFCCCELYSFQLQGSNDNQTWKVLHNVEKDARIRYCEIKTYDIDIQDSFKYIRLESQEAYPGCPFCIQINEIQLYGEVIQSFDSYEYDSDESEEAVSIIGKIAKHRE